MRGIGECNWVERWESCKASLRAKVEHPCRVIKRQFGYTKVRYRGLASLSNLWVVRWQLLPAQGKIRPEVPVRAL